VVSECGAPVSPLLVVVLLSAGAATGHWTVPMPVKSWRELPVLVKRMGMKRKVRSIFMAVLIDFVMMNEKTILPNTSSFIRGEYGKTRSDSNRPTRPHRHVTSKSQSNYCWSFQHSWGDNGNNQVVTILLVEDMARGVW
jgi:hypothetical protein